MTKILPPYAGRIAHVSDLHLTDSAAEPTGLAEQRAELLELVHRMNGAKPNLWAVTGDLFGHTVPYRSTAAERNVFADVLRAMAAQAPVVVLSGNHDGLAELDIFERLQARWPIIVVKNLTTFFVEGADSVHFAVLALPYPSKRLLAARAAEKGIADVNAEATAMLAEICTGFGRALAQRAWEHSELTRGRKVIPVFLAHANVRGSVLAGVEVLAHQEPELLRHVLDEMPVAVTLLGHIHKPQRVGARAAYAGSPRPMDFGEENGKGGVLWVIGEPPTDADGLDDLLGMTEVLLQQPGDEYSHPTGQGLPTVTALHVKSTARRVLTLTYAWGTEEGGEAAPRWLVQPTERELMWVGGARVRVRLEVQQSHLATLPEKQLLAALGEMAPHSLKVERRVRPAVKVLAAVEPISARPTLWDMLTAHFDTTSAPPNDAERAALRPLFDELVASDGLTPIA